MRFQQLGAVVLIAWQVAAISLAGCQYLPFGQTAQTEDEEDEFGELEGSRLEQPRDLVPVEAPVAAPVDFSLKLEVGQRFPLTKTVEQRITQTLPSGPVVSHSRLDLQLSLLVEEVQASRRKLAVRYHRVRYLQEVGGQLVEYHSDLPSAVMPPEAWPYAGLKDNGFSFWLGEDHQILELVGFTDFLRRCVQHVPLEQQPTVLQQLQGLGTADGVASFVDDSLGLLPGKTQGIEWRVGSTWEITRRPGSADGGLPVTLRCLLKDLTDRTVEISLLGNINPVTYVDDVNQIQLTVLRGQTTGACTVDRVTGMPTRSRVERTLEMTARLPDGTLIPQRKEVVSTVLAFLEQPSAPVEHRVQQAVYQGVPGAPAR